MEMKYKRYCLFCGKLIPKKSESWARYKKKNYCSNKCQTASLKKPRKIGKCIVCRKEFEYKEGQQTGKFCSQKCFNIYQITRIKTKCDWCGKSIEVKKGFYQKYKYHLNKRNSQK